jgi:hypothetical protein
MIVRTILQGELNLREREHMDVHTGRWKYRWKPYWALATLGNLYLYRLSSAQEKDSIHYPFRADDGVCDFGAPFANNYPNIRYDSSKQLPNFKIRGHEIEEVQLQFSKNDSSKHKAKKSTGFVIKTKAATSGWPDAEYTFSDKLRDKQSTSGGHIQTWVEVLNCYSGKADDYSMMGDSIWVLRWNRGQGQVYQTIAADFKPLHAKVQQVTLVLASERNRKAKVEWDRRRHQRELELANAEIMEVQAKTIEVAYFQEPDPSAYDDPFEYMKQVNKIVLNRLAAVKAAELEQEEAVAQAEARATAAKAELADDFDIGVDDLADEIFPEKTFVGDPRSDVDMSSDEEYNYTKTDQVGKEHASIHEELDTLMGDVLAFAKKQLSVLIEILDDCLHTYPANGECMRWFAAIFQELLTNIFEMLLSNHDELSQGHIISLAIFCAKWHEEIEDCGHTGLPDECMKLENKLPHMQHALDDYVTRMTATLRSWMENIVSLGPQFDAVIGDGFLESSTPIDIFKMIREQMAMVGKCDNRIVLLQVLRGSANALQYFTQIAIKRVRQVFSTEELCCTCNDTSCFVDLLTRLIDDVEESLAEISNTPAFRYSNRSGRLLELVHKYWDQYRTDMPVARINSEFEQMFGEPLELDTRQTLVETLQGVDGLRCFQTEGEQHNTWVASVESTRHDTDFSHPHTCVDRFGRETVVMLNNVMPNFLEVYKACLVALVENLASELNGRKLWDSLYGDLWWTRMDETDFEENLEQEDHAITNICAVVRERMAELQRTMTPVFYRKFSMMVISKIVQSFVWRFLTALLDKPAVIDVEGRVIGAIAQHIQLLEDTLLEHIANTKQMAAFQVCRDLLELLSCPVRLFSLNLEFMVGRNDDVTPELVDVLMSLRADLYGHVDPMSVGELNFHASCLLTSTRFDLPIYLMNSRVL